jgi:NAD(P)H-dependent FMN reductase
MPVLRIVIASTRPGRVGLPVARWFEGVARDHRGFDVEVTDLAELDLPLFNEPKHPRFGEYEHQHTRDWSATVAAADAFVFVLPEYNYGYTAPLKNAIDYLNAEWNHKPLGFVSYGGVAAGTRAVQQLKQVVGALKLLPVTEAVNIPFVTQFLGDDGAIEPNDVMQQAAVVMLDELVRVEAALRTLRADTASRV